MQSNLFEMTKLPEKPNIMAMMPEEPNIMVRESNKVTVDAKEYKRMLKKSTVLDIAHDMLVHGYDADAVNMALVSGMSQAYAEEE